MSSSTTGEIGGRSHGWSPELLTVLGAVIMIGVGLAGLMLNIQGQIREDIRSLEARMNATEVRLHGEMNGLRDEMKAMETRIIKDLDRREARIREDTRTAETRIREDVRELRGDVGELRERVSHLEGRIGREEIPPRQPDGSTGATAPS